MTPKELKELIPIAEALNAESNDLNSTITAIDRKLAALNLGVEVWLNTGVMDGDVDVDIGYAKIETAKEPAWGLAISWCQYKKDEDGDWDVVPGSRSAPESLLKGTRQLRIKALEELPRLLFRLKTEAERNIGIIRKAKEMVAEI